MQKKLYVPKDKINYVLSNVTRFGEISPLRQNIKKVFGHFLTNYFVFGKIVNLLWKIFYTTGHIFIFQNGQIIQPFGHTVASAVKACSHQSQVAATVAEGQAAAGRCEKLENFLSCNRLSQVAADSQCSLNEP